MQHGVLCGGETRTSAERQAAASPGLYAFAGARAAKREIRVMARGRSSSHATMRSILIAAAIATCCKWVFPTPQYRVRRRPKARPAADTAAGPPRWQTRSAPRLAPRTGPGAAAAAAGLCAWHGYSRAARDTSHTCVG